MEGKVGTARWDERFDVVIVFVTGRIEFMQTGYEVRAFRYLLKEHLELLTVGMWEALDQYWCASMRAFRSGGEVSVYSIYYIIKIAKIQALYCPLPAGYNRRRSACPAAVRKRGAA